MEELVVLRQFGNVINLRITGCFLTFFTLPPFSALSIKIAASEQDQPIAPHEAHVMLCRGRKERMAFADSFAVAYHFRLLYLSSQCMYPVMGALRKTYEEENWQVIGSFLPAACHHSPQAMGRDEAAILLPCTFSENCPLGLLDGGCTPRHDGSRKMPLARCQLKARIAATF